MRLSLRFIVPLLVVLAAVAYALVPLVDRLMLRWFTRDLEARANLIATAVHDPLQSLVPKGDSAGVLGLFRRITQDERLFAMAFCPGGGNEMFSTPTLPPGVSCDALARYADPAQQLVRLGDTLLLVTVRPLALAGIPAGQLLLVHDLSFVTRRSAETKRYLFYFFVGLGLIMSLITVIVAQLSWHGWVRGMRALLRGEGLFLSLGVPSAPELRPIAHDLRALLRDLEAERARNHDDAGPWDGPRLRAILRSELRGDEVLVVSNREPYLHEREHGRVTLRRPASGLVTALEPVMRACSGVWIAHGSGTADREVVDAHDRIGVPPEAPCYQLRRVWLTPDEERGYYYGFANEGLWPLCHIAHVRPQFRVEDWTQYVSVNDRFARAVADEARTPDPIVLVQDYHLALLPRMVRKLLPGATIITFWHIPWPNPEAFGICPWRDEILDGLLGSNILGFHTQFHCNNFVDTVDRFVEARVDRELFTVSLRGNTTAVKRYPISIAHPAPESAQTPSRDDARAAVRARHGLPAGHALGLGVDRLDYTKGIEERFRAVERLLERQPERAGRFTFVQIAAPSRSRIEDYRDHEARVRACAARINERFATAAHPPILLLVQHHEPEQVREYYRAAEVCMVTSLHDGMNLVAKEFVAARDDEGGVLILSQFTGAARELAEALIVNPYDVEQCAAALTVALSMPLAEQRARMRLMRRLIEEFNVYRWAGGMLTDAAHMRRRGRLFETITAPAGWVRRAEVRGVVP